MLSHKCFLVHVHLVTLLVCRTQHDIMFMHNIFSGRTRSSFLLGSFLTNAPARNTRQQLLLHAPYARVNTVKEGLFVRLPRVVNMFLSQQPKVNLLSATFYSFRTSVKSCVSSI